MTPLPTDYLNECCLDCFVDAVERNGISEWLRLYTCERSLLHYSEKLSENQEELFK